MWFATFLSSMFVVGHPQYARSVRVMPLGPEQTRITISWLLLPDTLESHPHEVENIVSLARLVVEQDGRACELNQKGLHSNRHKEGVLVPQEDGVAWVHDWIRKMLGD